MKKLFLMLACSSMCIMGMNAQEKLVKEVEKEIGAAKYATLSEKLKPAFTDATSEKDAYTWFVAAKVEMNEFDELFKQKMIGKNVDATILGKHLLAGIDYLKKVLPLDTVPEVDKKTGAPKVDKKTGLVKVKTRFSKNVVSMLAENYSPLNSIMSEIHNAKDYANAVKAYELFITLPFEPYMVGKIAAPADTILGEIRFYQGIALWQGENPKDAVGAFEKARKLGYLKKEVFDYALNCAAQSNNEPAIVKIAEEALPLYGKQDGQYVRILINGYLNNQNYVEANKIVDQAILDDPQSAELVNLKGNLVENQKSIEEAFPYFKKAVDLDPTSSKAQFDLGRYYFNKAVKIRDEKTDLTGDALAKLVNPLYEQALPYLEKAYELDKGNIDAKNALRSIYYQLNDEEKLNAIEQY
ncbi:MAG: tetratricopeptide repeat protein [Muribaculaceae bacterium]|nr:tetratricopeptide repeat protein [Muribaculaceae bacterium]